MKYDAIVIGSGQGGNPLAYRMADLGWTVALVEKAHLGGTCINTGCTPTKTMVASAQVAHYTRNAARWGVHAGDMRVDPPLSHARTESWKVSAPASRAVLTPGRVCTSAAGSPASRAPTSLESKASCWRAGGPAKGAGPYG